MNPPTNTGDAEDSGSVPRLGRSPAEGKGNPLWYSWLENSITAEPGPVHGVTKGQT